MARRLTLDELERLLTNVPAKLREGAKKGVGLAAAQAEGQAKMNCGYVAGEDGVLPALAQGSYAACPYDRPPRITGRLCRGNFSEVREEGTAIAGLVGNSVNEYNTKIHDGTSSMKPRPFLLDAVQQQQPNIRKLIENELIKAFRQGRQ